MLVCNRATRRLVVAGLAALPLVAAARALGSPIPDALDQDMGFPYEAFDAMGPDTVLAEGAEFRLGYANDDFVLPKSDIADWVRHSAKAVATYYGKFPVSRDRLLFMPTPGGAVRGGTTWGYRGAASKINLGVAATRETVFADWVLVHEMIHTALPDVGRQHSWLSEGIAVYVESICRVQAGHLTEARIWRDFVRDMPKGQPMPDDRGFDFTHSWGRTYWGGATYCLLADLEIRRRSGNKFGLQQALRGLNAVTNHTEEWDIRKALSVADKATGFDVLASLYEQMRATPVATDLPKLWANLGIEPSGDGVSLADTAPMAALRKAIVAPATG